MTRFTDSTYLLRNLYRDATCLQARLALHERRRSNTTPWLRRHVQSMIEREGAFRISKDAGVLTATA